MKRVIVDPGQLVFHVKSGTKVRDFLLHNGILMDFPCGGKGICTQCRIVIDPPTSSGRGGQHPLPEEELAGGVRLACTAVIEDDCTITVPEGRRTDSVWRDPTHLEQTALLAGEALIKRRTVELPEPSLDDQRGDWERLRDTLEARNYVVERPPVDELDRISRVLRENQWKIDIILEDQHVVSACKSFQDNLFGFAIDLGTTTVDVSLHNLETGRSIARRTMLNRQASYGADVISRAQGFQQDRVKVRQAATRTIQECAQTLLDETGISPSQVVRSVVVGNPIMIHILHDINPLQLTLAPYICATTSMLRRRPSDFEWTFQEHGFVESLPLISAFVGADTVGMILSLDLDVEEGTSISIDVGTNGEIVLSQNGRLTTTSTAAGPAFEGAEISCGMRAQSGAVVGISSANGLPELRTVADAPPAGIAGTGLIAMIAFLLDHGVLDDTGRLLDPQEIANDALRERVFTTDGGDSAFGVVPDNSVYVSQKDIRELQLAKGAVRTGIEALLQAKGLQAADLDTVRLAGNFGGAMDVAAAMRIGLIPNVDPERVDIVGNAALRGAAATLVSKTYRRKAEDITSHASFLELAGRPEFQMMFAESMMFQTAE